MSASGIAIQLCLVGLAGYVSGAAASLLVSKVTKLVKSAKYQTSADGRKRKALYARVRSDTSTTDAAMLLRTEIIQQGALTFRQAYALCQKSIDSGEPVELPACITNTARLESAFDIEELE